MAIHYVQSQQVGTLEAAVNHFLSTVRLENKQEGQEGEALDALLTYLRRYGREFIEAMAEHFGRPGESDGTVAAALTLLGRVEHPKTHASRQNVLLNNLASPRVRVRDGVVAGLGYMMSKEAIPALEIAAKAETNRHLRRDMEHLLKLLMGM